MTGAACFLLLVQIFCMVCGSLSQRSPYSLQAAVDELHRREAAKYPLNAPPFQQRYLARALGATGESDYWDDDSDFPTNNNPNNQNRNRHRLNKALAKYLERESYDNDRGGLSLGPFGGYEFDEENNQLDPDEKKRASYFRERDSKYDLQPSSVFRERETPSSPGAGIAIPEHSELTEQFLKEIEEAQEHEREERYKDALRNLWEKYQTQDNEIEGDLFEEKKRVRIPPYYMLMQKKRSYPVLPWLPYAERKKRIPVAKRSTKRAINENNNLGKTDDKVARELSELFGSSSTTGDEKKKRSIDEQTRTTSTRAPTTTSTTDMLLEVPSKKDNATEAATNAATSVDGGGHETHQHGHEHGHEHNAHSGHTQKEHKHRKRSDHHGSHESHEDEEEGSESEEHEGEEEGEEEEEDEFEEEETEERKKKRDLSEAKRLNLRVPLRSTHLSKLRQKKSIDWSKYFGLDRKKKSVKENYSGVEVKKRSASDDDADNSEQEKKKRDLDPQKIDNMDRKLQSIEDFIIDETIKYTGAHEGIANPDEIRRLKDHVLSRLATAYSLEKMRRALDKLRQSVETENHLLRNVIDPEDHSENELEKRLSVKKEQAPLHELENMGLSTGNEKTKEIHSNSMMGSSSSADSSNKGDDSSDSNDELDAMKKHKKKRNGYLRYPELPNEFTDDDEDVGAGHYESLNDAYLGNKNYMIGSNQCPLIEAMAERCRGVDLLSGDINQELLPICGVHQICYLCGTSQVACDYQYLAEADSICGNQNDCQAAARSILMILRGTPGPQLGPRECLKNSCLHSAMREIGL